ncbi:MAG: sugar transferase [Pseudomonadota bacterium]
MSLSDDLNLTEFRDRARQPLLLPLDQGLRGQSDQDQHRESRLKRGWLNGPALTIKLTILTVVADLFAILCGFASAALIADSVRPILGAEAAANEVALLGRTYELALLSLLLVGIFSFGGLYRRSGWELDEVRRIILGVGLLALFDAALQFILRDHSSRLWFFFAYPMIAFLVISVRMALREIPTIRDAMTSHVMLLGAGTTSEELIFEMRNSRSEPVKLLGQLDFSKIDGRDPQRLAQMLDRLARNSNVPGGRIVTVLAPQADELSKAQEALAMLSEAQCPCSIILPFEGLARNGLSLQKAIGADMVMAEVEPTQPSAWGRFFKRLFDVTAGSLAVFLLSPVLIVLAVLLMAERGSVFFRQPRVGRDGRVFWCYKFRSMLPDAQERLEHLLSTNPAAKAEWDRSQKLQNDPRITKTGHFLRTTSLDELPQLFNVLTGDMSLVGPRPIIAPDVPGYPGDKAYYDSPDFAYYKACVPGITGLWQVSGRSNTSHDERVRLDRWYARNWSVWLDLMILLRTISVVLFRKGSA